MARRRSSRGVVWVVAGAAAAGVAFLFIRRVRAQAQVVGSEEEDLPAERALDTSQEEPSGAEPEPSGVGQLVRVQGKGKVVYLQAEAAAALARLQAAARDAGFAEPLLLPVSGFRSRQKQEGLWKRALERYKTEEEADDWVSRPGHSSHETGRAVDLWLGLAIDSSNVDKLRDTPVFKWLQSVAEQFEFYPYKKEPWHWEFGKPHQRDYSAETAELRAQGVIPD